jgi:hypothetical protein
MIISKVKAVGALPFSGQWAKLAITEVLLRYFEDLPFGCGGLVFGGGHGLLRISFSASFHFGTGCKLSSDAKH